MSSSASPLPTPHAAADVTFTSAGEGGPRIRKEQDEVPSSPASSQASRGKRSSVSDHVTALQNGSTQTPNTNGNAKGSRKASQRIKKSGGFLLDSLIPHSHQRARNGTQKESERVEQNGYITVDKRRSTHSRFSEESSHRGSPLSRELRQDDSERNSSSADPNSNSQIMDPTQLVQMALSLNESKKRHVSGTMIPVPVLTPAGNRKTPGLDAGYGTVRSRPASAQQPARFAEGLPKSAVPSAHAAHLNVDYADNSVDKTELGQYNFSPATLSRAEKARKYFELASEHRRLLEHLPPLRPSGSVVGSAPASSANGSLGEATKSSMAKTGNHGLGRSYNPLQALRNRRLRNRERRPLPAPPDAWHDPDRVKTWIDDVASASNESSWLDSDLVDLPEYAGELDADDVQAPAVSKGHRRTDTAGSVITRPENGWTIEPSELLADTYWTEKMDNKDLIEDRRGRRVCPSQAEFSGEAQRQSAPTHRDEADGFDRRSQHSLSEDDGIVRYRKRNRLPLAGRIRRRRLPHKTRAGSMTSLSSDEGRRPPEMLFGNHSGGDENIGPLERHMRDMIALDEKGDLSSPEQHSPDHWDSPQSRAPLSRISIDRRLRESRHHAHGRHSAEAPKHQRGGSTEGRLGSIDHGMSSVDEFASDTPSSPVIPALVPPMGMDLSPPPGKRPSTPELPSRATKLPIFRSQSKERNNIDQNDFAEISPLPPNMGDQLKDHITRANLDIPRPGQFVRHRTTESFTSNLRRLNTASTIAPSETSTKASGNRFFKGKRIHELVRSESSRLGDRLRIRDRAADHGGVSDISQAASDISDAEDSGVQRNRRSYIANVDETDASPRNSFEKDRQNPRYFLSNLPIFSSTATRRPTDNPQSTDSDPITMQQRAQREAGRSQRFQRLAPPKINLPDERQGLDPDSAEKSAKSSESKRRWANLRFRSPYTSGNPSAISLGAPGSINHADGHLPVTGLHGTLSNDSRRHWSISDKAPSKQVERVTMRDVNRVRALLLSSGVKAHEIVHLANTAREPPLGAIARAAKTAGKPTPNVPRKEEILIASRMLSEFISKSASDFDRSLVCFRNERAKALVSKLEHLQHRAGEDLTTLVRDTSDEADAFAVELTTRQPQEIKRVEDAVDYMFRQRRRRFRLLRRTGFKMLEWLTLSILWWVWLVVVLVQSFRRVFVSVFVFLRWLLWF